ncbi:MAG: PqqD family protein [Syntrophothermus sp.]
MKKLSIPHNLAISDTGFLFLPSTGETFTLNELGTDIIKLLQKGSTIEKIKSEIINNYDVKDANIEKDLDDFIIQLKSFNLLNEL